MPTKTAISFGLVHIPVSLQTAVIDNDVHFNQLRKGSTDRVRYKKVCSGCGRELSADEIVRGYEYEKGKYVVVSDDELELLKTEKDRAIRILHFSGISEINPIYYSKAYYLTPEPGGEKAFELLRLAMTKAKQSAIARAVIGTKDTLLALIPDGGGISAQTLLFSDELRNPPHSGKHPPVTEAELKMALQLVNGMISTFDPTEYHDEYTERVRELITAKIAGTKLPKQKAEKKSSVTDLMDALQRSVADIQGKTKKTSAKAKPKASPKTHTAARA